MLPTKTVQNVVDRVTRQFGDESGVQITSADIISWVNAAQMEIVKENKVLKGTATSASVSGNGTIDLTTISANILKILAIHYNGTPLNYLSFNEAQEIISKVDPTNSSSGVPVYIYEFGTSIFMYPVPQSSGDTIKIFYDAFPVAITTVSDTLSVPDAYFEIVVKYCLKQAYEQDDDWLGSQAKGGEVSTDLTRMAEDKNGYSAGTYPLITIYDEFGEGAYYA